DAGGLLPGLPSSSGRSGGGDHGDHGHVFRACADQTSARDDFREIAFSSFLVVDDMIRYILVYRNVKPQNRSSLRGFAAVIKLTYRPMRIDTRGSARASFV